MNLEIFHKDSKWSKFLAAKFLSTIYQMNPKTTTIHQKSKSMKMNKLRKKKSKLCIQSKKIKKLNHSSKLSSNSQNKSLLKPLFNLW